ncbi:TIGR01244 family sulfur transferase [Celerinatantimonas yamalensis]|uniref:TIGR01244 family sulfur transferase n=1 Tax=Celerinatantimonas yamalensis TaxID=559956 RepID=A0ABW9G8G7_9GAMM
MKIHYLEPNFAVSPQIEHTDLHDIAQLGFKTIICNRPDGEHHEQPSQQQLAQLAEELGLTFIYLPLQNGQIQQADGRQLAATIAETELPILAFCRSGTRSAIAWALANTAHRSAEEIRACVEAQGYSLNSCYIEQAHTLD